MEHRPPPWESAGRPSVATAEPTPVGDRDVPDGTAPVPAVRLVVRLLGDIGVSLGGEPVPDLTTPRALRLLARLTLADAHGVPRDRLAADLWPGSAAAQARTNLRKLLHGVRRLLPEPDRFVEIGPRTVRWRADPAGFVDAVAFCDAIGRGDPAAAAGHYGGPAAHPARAPVAAVTERAHAYDPGPVSARLAAHYEAAGLGRQAVAAYERAAAHAYRVFALDDGISLSLRALRCLQELPRGTVRDATELRLRAALGVPLVARRGYGAASVGRCYELALTLHRRLGSRPGPSVLRGLALHAVLTCRFDRAAELGDDLVSARRTTRTTFFHLNQNVEPAG